MAGAGHTGGETGRRWRLPLVLALIACVAATALVAAPAGAQEEEPPPEPLTIDVARYVVPKTRAKLIDKGVQVKARCNLDCVIVVKVKLPADVAKEVGVENRVIGSGAAGAKANQFRWVRARINKGAGDLLEDFEGGGRLEIRIRALP
jgi:hypothetical protein